jgi:UDP-GlcNAc:undecaprenyl-phosphate GlcNAc-1-phosphate transferase
VNGLSSVLPFALFLVPCLLSALLTGLLLRWVPRWGLLDHPGVRKVHTRPIPRGGGLAIYLALVIGCSVLYPTALPRLMMVLVVGLGIVVLGLVDDLRPLPWQFRLGLQMAAAGVVVWFWEGDMSWGVRALAVLWSVGLLNAFNMLDNMDALSAGVAWIVAAALAVAPLLQPERSLNWQAETASYLLLMGALSGFLWFNRPPARIFMGDAGSTFLGFFLGIRSLETTALAPGGWIRWGVPLCIFAVPLYDMTSVVLLRLWQGHSPFHADKQHLSHRLVALGLSSPGAVRLIHLMALASAAAGLLLYQISATAAFWVAGQLACWWLTIAGVEYFRHFRSRPVPSLPANAKQDPKVS